MHHKATPLLRLTLLAACVAIATPIAAADAVAKRSAKQGYGCYEVTISPWQPTLQLGKDIAYVTPPMILELTSKPFVRARTTAQWFLIRSVQQSSDYVHPYSAWCVEPDGTLILSWSDGFSGLSATLKWDGYRYIGTATTNWDFDREK